MLFKSMQTQKGDCKADSGLPEKPRPASDTPNPRPAHSPIPGQEQHSKVCSQRGEALITE